MTEPCRPSGLPRASTWSPTCMASLSPNLAALRPSRPLALTTARSVFGSVPTILAVGGLAVGEDHPDGVAGGGGDHVVVGQHVAVGAEDHAGALAVVGGDRDHAVLHRRGDLRQVGAVDHRRGRVGAGDAAAGRRRRPGRAPRRPRRSRASGRRPPPPRRRTWPPGPAWGRRAGRPRRDRLAGLLRPARTTGAGRPRVAGGRLPRIAAGRLPARAVPCWPGNRRHRADRRRRSRADRDSPRAGTRAGLARGAGRRCWPG